MDTVSSDTCVIIMNSNEHVNNYIILMCESITIQTHLLMYLTLIVVITVQNEYSGTSE